MNRKDFQGLAALRLKEARILLRNNCWEGAYYLAGYSAECAIKACIARQTARHDFPDKFRVNASYTHNLEALIKLADLVNPLKDAEMTHPELNANWKIVRQWGDANHRYDRASRSDAEALINAIGDKGHGVLQWLKQYW